MIARGHGSLIATLVAGLALCLTVPAAGAATVGSAAHAAGERSKKAPKTVKCQKSAVAIKVNRRAVGCRSLGAAMPRPRGGDSRLQLIQFALADELGGLRDRHGRRAPSLKAMFRKVNPHAWAAVQSAIPRGLARIDRLAARSAELISRRTARSSGASACSQPVPTASDTFSSSGGGEKLTATMTLGQESTLGLELESADYSIHLEMTNDGCNRFQAPNCPTANGLIDATDSSSLRISLSIAKRREVLVSKDVAFAGQTRMQAVTDENAKLDFIDIDDTQTANITLGGAKQAFGPINLLYTGIHHARVDMPAGTYVPSQSAVDVAVTVRGVTFGKSDLGSAATELATSLDKDFATLIAQEIGRFTSLEPRWNEPNKCVTLDFTPATKSLTLHRRDHGSFTAQAIAEQGGGASPGRWTLTGQQNANFDPQQAQSANPQFTYDVTNAGKDILVVATIRATTRAGVAQDSWTQKTEDNPLYVGEVHGSVSVQLAGGDCPTHLDWSYSASLEDISGSGHPFAILQNDPPNPPEGSAQAYDESGGGRFSQPTCRGLPGCSTDLVRDPGASPGAVLFSLNGDTVSASVNRMALKGVTDTCADNDINVTARLLNNGTFPVNMIGNDTITVDLSYHDDAVTINGTLTLHRVN